VDALFDAMAAAGRDARALAGASVVAIGLATAAALARRGVIADIVPERFVAESLAGALQAVELAGRPALVVQPAIARDVLPDALRDQGADVDVVAFYETVAEQPAAAVLTAAREADYVTFTSSSTVRNLIAVLTDGFPDGARVVSIGPVTSEAAREHGLEVHVEAERHDVDGLLDALLADARNVV
jgi:uroporphyrinogen III methyltransferase/synthase